MSRPQATDFMARDELLEYLKTQIKVFSTNATLDFEHIYSGLALCLLTMPMINILAKQHDWEVEFNGQIPDDVTGILKYAVTWAQRDPEVARQLTLYLTLNAIKVCPEGMRNWGQILKSLVQPEH